jgi:8-oxo-dGTP pyrophosphatase MutT (NUDIX family)
MKNNPEDILKEFDRKLPHFPDGRIDYSPSRRAAVLTCFVTYQGRLLLLKRSDKVSTYQGQWDAVAGYIDENIPLEVKALKELREEIGIRKEDVLSFHAGKPYSFTDKEIDKTWIIFPCRAELKQLFDPKLDWEHTTYLWIAPEDLSEYPLIPHLEESYLNTL